MGLHVKLDKVFRDNGFKQGEGVQRKNKFIINTGDNLTQEEREKKIKQNKITYGLSMEEIRNLRLPKSNKTGSKRGDTVLTLDQIFHPKSNFSIMEKLHHLTNLGQAARHKLRCIQMARRERFQRYRDCNQVIVLQKDPNEKYSLVEIMEE